MTDKQIDLISAISEHGSIVRNCGYELADLSSAAYSLGQDRLGKTLHNIQTALNESFDKLNRAHGEAVHDNFVRAEESTMNLMRGVLAGIDIGGKDGIK